MNRGFNIYNIVESADIQFNNCSSTLERLVGSQGSSYMQLIKMLLEPQYVSGYSAGCENMNVELKHTLWKLSAIQTACSILESEKIELQENLTATQLELRKAYKTISAGRSITQTSGTGSSAVSLPQNRKRHIRLAPPEFYHDSSKKRPSTKNTLPHIEQNERLKQ